MAFKGYNCGEIMFDSYFLLLEYLDSITEFYLDNILEEKNSKLIL